MRILYSSNAPWVPTGYGVQTAIATRYLRELGHDVAVLAFYGLEGAMCDMANVPVYGNDPRDYGVQRARMYYDHFKADILLTHVDVWVCGNLDANLNWVPRLPIDHDPAPPGVVNVLKNHPAIIKPIVESMYGQRKLAEQGIDAYYIPPAVDCEVFKPDPKWREIGRKRYGWEDKFVIGMLATNHEERKNWTTAMKAVKIFNDAYPGKSVFYMHTELYHPRGINLAALRESLGMQPYTYVPSLTEMAVGIDRETLSHTYNALDVFLLPTKGEGACVPIIEAQSCGVPVITTKCTSQEENVGGGWFIEQLDPIWTNQNAWQFGCRTEEVFDRLEQAYKAWQDGSIKEKQEQSRKRALDFDERVLFREKWDPFLKDIERMIKEPRNREGVQQWRLNFIPKTCVPRKVLDIGCGVTQPYKRHLQHLGDYVGIDLKGGDGVMICDGHKLPFEDEEFGFVWMSEVLEHAENPKKMIAEAKRVGTHGICLFSTPMNPYFRGDPDHKVVDMPYTTLGGGDGLISW